jgi:hypothetical protein
MLIESVTPERTFLLTNNKTREDFKNRYIRTSGLYYQKLKIFLTNFKVIVFVQNSLNK